MACRDPGIRGINVKAMIAHELGHVNLGERGFCNRFNSRTKEYTDCEHDADEEGAKLVPRCDMVLALSQTRTYLLTRKIDVNDLVDRINMLDPTQSCAN